MNNRAPKEPTKKTTKTNNLRAECANIAFQVVEQGQSLSAVLARSQKNIDEKDRALMQEICFGLLRVLPELEFYIQSLMEKVLTGKNRVFHFLLLTGIYQVIYTRIPPHAAVGETVNGAVSLKKPQLKGLINGVLREFLRQQDELKQKFTQQGVEHPEAISLHPSWFIKRIKHAYPGQWQSIISANNQKPPMWLRVNTNYYTAEEYRALLQQSGIDAVCHDELNCALRLLSPVAVTQLPRFAEGVVTVQDLSAQYAAYLLAPQNDETILDLCAAPGGKTTHILESAPNANVMAVDVDRERVKRIHENLTRLKLNAEVKVGDGLTPEKWCADQQFDRILLDAPCSATGVIRRHPDIKWLRKDADIAQLAKLQQGILQAIWPYLKPGGTLLYATCSILPDENKQQIAHFLTTSPDANLVQEVKQFLPEDEAGDGFFYALLQKNNS